MLTELARQAGLAFHNSRLDSALQTTLDELRQQAEELRESRARVVASGDAERRRVERNLHDGAQQHLVALAINLRLTRDIVTEDPDGATEMLGQLAEDVQATIKELRELAHGIYPPLLADNGLGGRAERRGQPQPPQGPVDVADGVGRYPAEVEAAIYFSCPEALQNAAKHAGDATVDLRLWTESGGLLFSVTDDGPGFDARDGPRRPRLRQHGRPARRDRRHRPLGLPARARGHHQRVNPAGRLGDSGTDTAPESRSCHSWRSASAPNRSLFT